MNIKNWQKWFVCVFAVMVVSIYFILDVLFFNTSTSMQNLNQSIIAEDEFIEGTVEITEAEDKQQENQAEIKQDPQIPFYKNGWDCINDAVNRTFSSKYKKYSFVSSGQAVGQVQKIKGLHYHIDKQYISETFAFSESPLGVSFYERILSDENAVKYTVIKTDTIDSSLRYNLTNASKTEYSYNDFHNNYKARKQVFSCVPTKQNAKLTNFNSRQDEKYYIVSVLFNNGNIPKEYFECVKNNAGASNVVYKYFEMKFYISKTSGKIEKIMQNEQYKLTKGITVDIQYSLTGNITYYDQKIEVKF